MVMFCEIQEHQPIIDEHSGDHVCEKCGLCLGPVYQCQDKDTPEKNFVSPERITSEHSYSKNSSLSKWKERYYYTRDRIDEICFQLHIEGRDLINSIISDFEDLAKQEFIMKPRAPKQMDLATVSIYNSLKKEYIHPPSIVDIGHVTQANMKNVWKLLKKIKYHKNLKAQEKSKMLFQNPLSPCDIIKSKLGYLSLDRQDYKFMEVSCNKAQTMYQDFSARTIAACMTYLYLKKSNKKKKESSHTIKKIAELFSTSATSIYRYKNYLKHNKIDIFE